MTEKEAYLILNVVPDVGSVRIRNLVRHFGSAEKVIGASSSRLEEVEGIGRKISGNILNWKNFFDLKKECRLLEKLEINVITIDDPSYPFLLKEIYDPPVVLYVKGEILPEDRNAVAIVGARIASYYGINTARRFGRELASRNITIVSGMARGVDTAAHNGALTAKGRTLAVFGCGLDIVYPPENRELMEEIASSGAVLSEFPFGTPPSRQNFPRRNRIISGLSLGVIVIEAGKNSGSLITARFAGEQGRDVFSVPGRIDTAASQGTNVLIKNGAKPVLDIDDILDELNLAPLEAISIDKEPGKLVAHTESNAPSSVKPPLTGFGHKDVDAGKVKPLGLSGSEQKLFSSLSEEPVTVDDLVGAAGIPINEVWSGLVNLELRGLVKRLPGSKFIKKY